MATYIVGVITSRGGKHGFLIIIGSQTSSRNGEGRDVCMNAVGGVG